MQEDVLRNSKDWIELVYCAVLWGCKNVNKKRKKLLYNATVKKKTGDSPVPTINKNYNFAK